MQLETVIKRLPSLRERAISRFKPKTVSQEDSLDMSFDVLSSEKDDQGPFIFAIVYKDSSGQLSERVVRFHNLKKYSSGLQVLGYCELRKAARVFKLDNIQQLVCLRTGEYIQNPREYLLGIFDVMVMDDPQAKERKKTEQKVWKVCKPLASLLLYLMRCDGEHEAEWMSFQRSLAEFLEWSDFLEFDNVWPSISDKARGYYPESHDAIQGWDDLVELGYKKSKINKHIRDIIESDGKLTSEEFEAYRDLYEISYFADEERPLRFFSKRSPDPS